MQLTRLSVAIVSYVLLTFPITVQSLVAQQHHTVNETLTDFIFA